MSRTAKQAQVRKGGLPPLSEQRGQAPLPDLLFSSDLVLLEIRIPLELWSGFGGGFAIEFSPADDRAAQRYRH